jgi:hypothetical protein
MRSAALVAVACVAAVTAGSVGGCTSKSDQPETLSRDELLDPETCKQCHADHYREWSGSMHAYAADDPVFLAMNKRGQRETGGKLGTFCVNCHAPMAVRENLTKDGLNLAELPAKVKGVTCFFCHSVDKVEGSHNAQLHLADDLVMRGSYRDPVANTAHRAAYSPLHDRDQLDSAAMCGTCHDIVTDHGAQLERTYLEWQASVFAKAPGGATCGQCHMNQSAALEPIAQAPNVFSRRRHGHGFPGVDVALTPFPEAAQQKRDVKNLLDSTLQTALCFSPTGSIRVFLDNVAGGHSFPSGATQDRRNWVEVVAYTGANPVYQSGVVPDGKSVTSLQDPDLWLLRDCMFDRGGAEVHMFWDAAQTEGNALPAQVTFDPGDPRFYQTHIVRAYPRSGNIPGAASIDRVTMRVRTQPIGLDVLDDLVASGDLDRSVRDAMPTFDLGADGILEWTAATATEQLVDDRIPFSCVTKTNFNVRADRVPAKERTRCKP